MNHYYFVFTYFFCFLNELLVGALQFTMMFLIAIIHIIFNNKPLGPPGHKISGHKVSISIYNSPLKKSIFFSKNQTF